MANTLQGLEGLDFGTAMSTNPRMVNRLDALRETGVPVIDQYDNEPEMRFRRAMKNVDEQNDMLMQMANWRPSRNERIMSQRNAFLTSEPEENIGLEAAYSGYGDSRFDQRMTSPAQLEDIEDSRARMQSGLGVLANSVAKMGVLAGTTAADSWVGLPAGLINLQREISSGNVQSGRDALNALIDNPVSSYLQNINERSEEIFRNYQTAEERNRPWWENMFTANFIGDTIIKNAGFTIGAVVGGKAAVSALGRMTGAKEARDAFKGLAAELGLSGKSASEIVEMLAKGTTSLEKKAAIKALEESARNLKNVELGLRIAGGLLAGTGEARIEALNGVSELERSYEEIYGNLDLQRANALQLVKNDMAAKGLDINTPEGLAYYNEKKGLIDENYFALQEQIAHDKAMTANSIFALNVPLLTSGDMIQWGKLMLGGYAVDRNIVNGIKKVAEKSAIKNAAKSPADLVASTRYAVKGNKFTNTLGKIGAASRNVFIEMQEEMNQSLFSATAKAKAMGDTTEFMERLYDPMAVHDTVSWLDAAKEGMRQSWLNKDDWVEGFAGGFMGFMGLPSISVRVNEKNGKQVPRVTMEGGIWSPLREQSDLYKRREELVKTINNRLSSPEFLNYYYGKIGNRHFDSIKEDAVKKGDKGLYEKADHAQLINDAIMFEKAGRLQDFIDIVDSFKNVSDETINEIKNLFPENADVQKYTTSGMRTLINDNVDKIDRRLQNYMKIADNIRTVYGNTLDDATVAEMTWQTAHLDEIEYDLKDILSNPDTSVFLSQYRSENSEKTKDLTDYEVVSSGGYDTWLRNKFNDKKDMADKSKLTNAINDASDARYDMNERSRYIDNLSALSSDPELVQKRMSRIKQQQEELRRLSRMVKAAKVLSTTDKLSDFISAMDEFGDDVSPETLADIKREADNGNVTAKEYLMVRDIDSDLDEQIQRMGEKAGASDTEIQQAKHAWTYFKNTADSAYDLISRHVPNDIASSVAGEKALAILDDAIEAVLKSRNLYNKIAKRPAVKKKTNDSAPASNRTQFNTVGDGLTLSRFNEIVKELQKDTTGTGAFMGSFILRIDLNRGDFLFDGKPASGIVYGYYRGNSIYENKNNFAIPVLFDEDGNEIAQEDVKKITGPRGQEITAWLLDNDFPVAGMRKYPVITDGLAKKTMAQVPIKQKRAERPKKDSTKDETGNKPGSKTNPHKFIAPNTDMSLLGGDSQAVAELLKSLPVDSEVRFGIMKKDGPIYILAGDSNMRIGTLPRQDNDSDVYSGLAELETLIRNEFKESSDRRNADGVWISEKYVNHIREKEYSRFVPTEENVPLDEIPGFSGIKEPAIMFVYDKDGKQYIEFSNSSVNESDLVRKRGLTDESYKSGFAYLLVPSGKKYIPVMLYTQNVNEDTLDLHDSAVTSSGFGKRVSDAIDNVVAAITEPDTNKRVNAFRRSALNISSSKSKDKFESSSDSLQRLLYFGSSDEYLTQFYIKETCKEHPGWFVNDNTVMVINRKNVKTGENDWTPIVSGKKKADGTEYSLRDQIIDTIYDFEYQTENGDVHYGPVAQIHPRHFDDPKALKERIREFIDSKMLLTNVKDFDLTVPSFIMDYWSVSQGKFIRPSDAPAKMQSTGPKVTTKKTKTRGLEKVVKTEFGNTPIEFNLTSGQVKIGDGKWFSADNASKFDELAAKRLGFKNLAMFVKTVRAVATIANKYGDSESGDGRIGNRVLLKGFDSRKDVGFILGENGGTFMTPEELVKFKAELKASKPSAAEKRMQERKRVQEATQAPQRPEPEENEDEFMQETSSPFSIKADEIARMEKIRNIRGAINMLRKNAPQYIPFLDYISGIGYYDDVLIELADVVDVNNPGTVGQNRMRFRGAEFSNHIIVGRNSMGYHTLMHELVHAFTSVALKYDDTLREDVKTAMDFLRDSVGHSKLVSALGTNGLYAFQNVYEFVSEFFSNPKLQELAKSVEMPDVHEEKNDNVFRRIVNYIAKALRSVFRRDAKKTTAYDKLNDLLYSVVDRQIELQETGKMVYKNNLEFNNARRIANGAKVEGVAFSMKIPTVEEDRDVRYVLPVEEDRSVGVEELISYPSGTKRADMNMLGLMQLLYGNDEYSSYSGLRRLLGSTDVYEFSNGTQSSLVGVKLGEIFITVRSLPTMQNSSYESLIKDVVDNKMPVIIGSSPEDVNYYITLGMHPVHGGTVGDKIFVANKAFTEDDLFKLGTTYRPFAYVLDANSRFNALRKESYTDDEWNKFSEFEKYHARKCIGL